MSSLVDIAAPPQPPAVTSWVERVEPVWDVTVARELVARLPVPGEGATALVAGCRTGLTVLQLARLMPNLRRIIAVDDDRELVNQAHATVEEVSRPSIFFQTQSTRSLSFADDVFATGLCVAGVHGLVGAMNTLSALERVVAPEGAVGLAVLGASSFAIARELIIEELWARGDERAADLSAQDVTESALETAGTACGLTLRVSGSTQVPVQGATVRELFTHPLIAGDFLESLRPILPDVDDIWEAVRARGDAWFGDRPVQDVVEVLWGVWQVTPPVIAVDDDDDVVVVDESPLGDDAGGEARPEAP